MILRADPGASDRVNICRVYSHEINAQEKLRNVLGKFLGENGDDIYLSSRTLQRMIDSYLKERNCRIQFTQSDHNACPTCKTLKYSLLQYTQEVKLLEERKAGVLPLQRLLARSHSALLKQLDAKRFQEEQALQELIRHNQRDTEIRRFLKNLF